MLGWEPVERQQVSLGVLQQPGNLGGMRAELVDDLAQPLARLGGRPAVKIPRIAPDTSGCWARATCPSMSLRKWTVHRCQAQPNTLAMAD